MPSVLEANEIDQLDEEVEEVLSAEEEEYEAGRYASKGDAPDLSDGGTVNGVRVRPSRDKRVTRGRAIARKAWMWNGTESLLPLAWDPDGKIHDGAKRYFLKRYCLCCRFGGFKTRHCPMCIKNGCSHCDHSTMPEKVIACFYRTKAAVPFPSKFYGSVDCF